MLAIILNILLMHDMEQLWCGPVTPSEALPIPCRYVILPPRNNGAEELEAYSVGKPSRPVARRMENHISAFWPYTGFGNSFFCFSSMSRSRIALTRLS